MAGRFHRPHLTPLPLTFLTVFIQNFGILCAFGIGFFFFLLVFTEYNTGTSSEKAVVLFKRGTKPPVLKEAEAAVGDDEEKKDASTTTTATGAQAVDPVKDEEKAKQALEEQPKMTNVFSWEHLNYAVKTGGGEYRKLLDDVSGFVAPGKLTALMGESGAGKVSSIVALPEGMLLTSTSDYAAQCTRRKDGQWRYYGRPVLQRPGFTTRLPVTDRVLPADGYSC